MDNDEDGQMIEHSQMWRVFRNGIAEIYPAFRNMESFKRCWESFCQSLQREPRSTFFHLFVAAFGILPFFGFIMFITGAFLLTFVTGFIAFWFMFFSGLIVFATLTFFILVCCVWLSWIMAGALTVWMEWPYINGGVCTIRRKALDKLAEFGFFSKGQANGNSNSDDNHCHNKDSCYEKHQRFDDNGDEDQRFDNNGDEDHQHFEDSGNENSHHFKDNGNKNHHRFEDSGNRKHHFVDNDSESHHPLHNSLGTCLNQNNWDNHTEE